MILPKGSANIPAQTGAEVCTFVTHLIKQSPIKPEMFYLLRLNESNYFINEKHVNYITILYKNNKNDSFFQMSSEFKVKYNKIKNNLC